MIGKRYKTKD